MSYIKKVIKGTSIVFITYLFSALFGYIFRLLLIKNLNLNEVGLFFSIFSLLSLVYGFRNVGFGRAFVRFASEFRVKKKFGKIKQYLHTLFGIQFLFYLILSLILVIFFPIIEQEYIKVTGFFPIFLALIACFGFTTYISTFRSLFQAFQNMTFFSILDSLQSIFLLIFTFIVFLFNKSIFAPIMGYFISFFIASTILPKTTNKPGKKITKKIFIYSIPFILVRIGNSIMGSIDSIFLTIFQTLESVALYNLILPITQILRLFIKSFSAIIFPVSSELYFRNSSKLKKGLELAHKYLYLFFLPLSILIIIFSKEIIFLLYGFSVLKAHTALKILILGIFFSAGFELNKSILIGIDQPKEYAKIVTFGAFLNIVLNLFLIPLFSILGAAFSVLISNLIMLFFSNILISKYIKETRLFKHLVPSFFLNGILYLSFVSLYQFIHLNQIILFMFLSSLILLFYFLFLFSFKLLTFKELKKIFNVFF